MDQHKSYGRLFLMFGLHLVAMYVLMYAMVDTIANVHPNHNQLYMAALMAAPMLVLELLFMNAMYPNKKLNMGLMAASLALLVSSFFFIREQTAVADEQFLKSMIPHHASALLMCKEAHLTDPDIQKLCAEIRKGQQSEIDWMTAKLDTFQTH